MAMTSKPNKLLGLETAATVYPMPSGCDFYAITHFEVRTADGTIIHSSKSLTQAHDIADAFNRGVKLATPAEPERKEST